MKTTLLVLVLIAAAVGGYLWFRPGPEQAGDGSISRELLHTVQRGTLTVTLSENGTLMAKNSEKITPQIKRSGKITFLIEEGKTVEEGEVLCRLDTTDLEEQLQQLELDVVKTEADLNTAQTELDIQRSENAASIEKAKIALSKAKKELERYRDGDAPKERRNLEVAIKEAQTRYSRAEKKYEDSLKLLEQDYITKSQVEQDKIDYERAEIQLRGANWDLEIFDKYTYPMTMTDKQTGVSDAERALENADKRAASTLRQREVAVESQESRLTRLKKQLDEVKEEIEHFTINAPCPGIVIYGDPERPWYRSEIKLGANVWGGLNLFTIPDLRVMQVQVQVHEADINKVEEGQPATVTMDTYPGLVVKGEITKIASIAGGSDWRRGSDEVKEFTVDITLEEIADLVLKPGVSAKAEIFIEELEDVLFVPIQCVFFEDEAHYCYRLSAAGEPAKTQVKPGVSNENFMHVLEGLQEKDRVLLYNPKLRPEAASSEEDAAPAPLPPDEGAPRPVPND
ncbi:MAG: efflux RND transporter periplasmic adaptor subunit [Planctomycetota bacterium]|nr:efflux RND transporter periplasmic adaptor subunit [Planctomycetota bacterium]